MEYKYVKPAQSATENREAKPPYMVFGPDDDECFQMLTSGQRRKAKPTNVFADKAFIPISEEDVTPLQEAKIMGDDAKLLKVIRKYVQTHGLGLGAQADSLNGTTHTVPEGSYLLSGRVRHDVQGLEFNEVPAPKKKRN